MDSNWPLPYDVEEIEELSYLFVNRDGIRYHVYFNPMFLYYPQFPNTYAFNIEPEDKTPHAIDRRIAVTIVEILRQFFKNMENAMIMVCDSTDGKEQKRRLLFDLWFENYNDGSLCKMDASASTPEYDMYLSIYYKEQNPNKKQLLEAFRELMNGDLYEIVI